MILVWCAVCFWFLACMLDISHTVHHKQYNKNEQNPAVRLLSTRMSFITSVMVVVIAECALVLWVAPVVLSSVYGDVLFDDDTANGYWWMLGVCALVGGAAHVSAILQSRKFVAQQ